MSSLTMLPAIAGAEDVADALIEYQFGRHAGIDAADDDGRGKLSARGCPNLFEQIAVPHVLRDEALVPGLEFVQGVVRVERRLPFLRQRRALIGRECPIEGQQAARDRSAAAEVSSREHRASSLGEGGLSRCRL